VPVFSVRSRRSRRCSRSASSRPLAIEQRYRERAKEAREKAESASNEMSRRTWIEIAKGFKRLADEPPRDPYGEWNGSSERKSRDSSGVALIVEATDE
jgi:hypothetical protein